MELRVETSPCDGAGSDDRVRQMLQDILSGLKTKMVLPVIEENRKLSRQLAEFKGEEQARAAELKNRLTELLERLNTLEARLQEVPLVVLGAIRDAINQAGGEN
ncbi:MAG: hypothetical protein K6T80_03340 [Firmicutes bacterium]|nr:hypothetical protein [Bacillota bacterium]